MKHIWYIDEDKYELNEGYVSDNYKTYYNKDSNIPIWNNMFGESITTSNLENIFDNIETAKHILKGMIQIQRDKNSKEIEILQKENEILFEKLLNV